MLKFTLNGLKFFWPFLKEILFDDKDIIASLRRHWVTWVLIAINLLLLSSVIFMSDQAMLQLREVNQKTAENKILTDKISKLIPQGIDGVDTAIAIGRRIDDLEIRVDYYKKEYESSQETIRVLKEKSNCPVPKAITRITGPVAKPALPRSRREPTIPMNREPPAAIPVTITSLKDKLEALQDKERDNE